MRRHWPLILVGGGVAGLWASPAGDAPKFRERPEDPAVMVDEDEEFALPQQEYAFNRCRRETSSRLGFSTRRRAATGRSRCAIWKRPAGTLDWPRHSGDWAWHGRSCPSPRRPPVAIGAA